ncbi:hypothetical protein BSPLISOX_2329 [uncultured Gammaproteobacteria bacterium]|nr:hypothetical protein BSPLISOX_2329 [uncultured Gammaproteobacteria bacterium]
MSVYSHFVTPPLSLAIFHLRQNVRVYDYKSTTQTVSNAKIKPNILFL